MSSSRSNPRVYVGLDPGPTNGAIAYRFENWHGMEPWNIVAMPQTEQDLWTDFGQLLHDWKQNPSLQIYMAIEHNPSPHRGGPDSIYSNAIRGSISLAQNEACLRMIGYSLGLIPSFSFFLVSPKEWMTWMDPHRPPPPKRESRPTKPKDFRGWGNGRIINTAKLGHEEAKKYVALLQEWRAGKNDFADIYRAYALVAKDRLNRAAVSHIGVGNLPAARIRKQTGLLAKRYADATGICLWLQHKVKENER